MKPLFETEQKHNGHKGNECDQEEFKQWIHRLAISCGVGTDVPCNAIAAGCARYT